MSYLFVAGISIAVFLIVLLLAKPNKQTPDYIFAALLFFAAQTIFNTFLVYTNLYFQYPNALVIGLAAPIAVPPFFYLYTKYQTQNIRFKIIDIFHLVPFLFVSLLYINFYFLPFAEKIAIMKQDKIEYREIFRISLSYTSGFIYFILSLRLLMKFRKNIKHNFSNTERIQFNWLLFLIVSMLIIWLIVLIIQDDQIISISATVFVILLGYFGITQVNVFNGSNVFFFSIEPITPIEIDEELLELIEDKKYKNSLLSDEEAMHIHEELKIVLNKDKPYLNPELTLGQLAKILKVHPNKLSEVINTKENKSFYDLINELRIQEFLKQVVKSENRQFTFTSLAYDCGFNSKASFNRNFKKHTGTTPSEFLNNFLDSQSE